jgi:hypothetical protein
VPLGPALVIHGHGIRRFGKRPFQIAIHIHAGAPVAHPISAGVHPWHGPRITGQALGAQESANLADLQRDRGRQDLAHSRQTLQPLHLRRHLHQLFQPLLELPNLFAQHVQLCQHLLYHPARLCRQRFDPRLQFASRALSVRVAVLAGRQTPLRQRRRDPILPARALRHQHHPRARQLPQFPQRPRRNPYRRQRLVALQLVQSVRIQPVGFVRQPHHQFRFSRMHQPRLQTCLLDLVGNPIPVRRGLDRYCRPRCAAYQSIANRPRRVRQPELPQLPAGHFLALHPGVALVTVECDIFFHARLLSFSKRGFHRQLMPPAGVALSYFHPEPLHRKGSAFLSRIFSVIAPSPPERRHHRPHPLFLPYQISNFRSEIAPSPIHPIDATSAHSANSNTLRAWISSTHSIRMLTHAYLLTQSNHPC